ncbi:MAG: SGNH/GDSL hydrolase family protein [Janthinobacterium lividum]
MLKLLTRAALAALCLSFDMSAHAVQTTVATFDKAVVWASPPAVATGTVEQDVISGGIKASALRVDITAKESDPNDVQVLSQPFSLTNGQQYTITYQAKADVPRTDPLAVRINAPDWHSVGYSNQSVQLGTSWHMYTETFTAGSVGAGNNVVAFSVGDHTGTLWIADLKVMTDQAAAAASPVMTAPVTTASATAGKNLVATFVGALVWSNIPTEAAGSIENDTVVTGIPVPSLRVEISAKSDNPNDVQVFSRPFSLSNGQKYTLTYAAKSDAARAAAVDVRFNSGDYHSIGYSNAAVPLGPHWQRYAETFTAANASGDNNVVAFSLGNQTGSVWIANLKVTTDGPVDAKSELPGGPGPALSTIPKNAYRILFVGNSITQHGFNAETIQTMGWDHVSGMAASTQSKDYVHLLAAKIQALMPGRPVAVRITSLIAGGMGSPDYRISPVVADSAGYDPNLVIIQHGEHEQKPLGAGAIADTYNKLLDLFTTAPSRPQVVCVGVWSSQLNSAGTAYTDWSATVEATMRSICDARRIPYISVAGIAADPADHGFGKDIGIQWHPNDLAHAKYADAIFAVVRPLLTKNTAHLPQPPHAARTARKINL